MEIPNVKKEAHQQIDSLEGNILGIVQIMVDDKGHVSVCVGGIPDVIVAIMAKAMRDNHQIKDLFGSIAQLDRTRANKRVLNKF